MTITVFLMVLFAALLHAVWNALIKVQGDRLVAMALITGCCGLVSLCVLPFVPFPASAAWPFIWLSIALHNGYYLLLILAYRYGDLSHVYPIARGSSPLIVAVVSVLVVGEVLTRQAQLSVVLIALAIMSLALTRGRAGLREPRAVFFALGTGLFIAGYTVTDGVGARLAGSAHGYTAWLFAIDAIPLAALALWVRGREVVWRVVRRSWRPGLVGGVCSLAAYWIVIWAMTLAPPALVSALRETSIIFAMLFGVFLLKERLDLKRLAAVAATLVGTVMLKTSR